MWDDIRKLETQYNTAVLSTQDADGFPTSIRVTPVYDDNSQTIKITLPAQFEGQAGSASLLYHYLSEELWDLTNYLIRGTLTQDGDTWTLKPAKLIASMSTNPIDQVKFIFSSRKRAQTYLDQHNLSRPKVNWDAIKALQKKAGNI